jgi:hypothetical protein
MSGLCTLGENSFQCKKEAAISSCGARCLELPGSGLRSFGVMGGGIEIRPKVVGSDDVALMELEVKREVW